MPTVDHFLGIFDAVSRKDWKDLKSIADDVAEYERKKKHYSAATKIKEAAEIVLANSAREDFLSVQSQTAIAPPIDLLKKVSFQEKNPLVIPQWLTLEVDSFCREWEIRKQLQDKDIFPRNTILLHGPPGCGKTMLAYHMANEMNRELYTVRFDSLVSSYLGETGENLRKIFDFAESNQCVLFLDEIDAIAKLRDDKSELGELKRVVISLLQNIDSLSSETILIAATNHAHMLDPAIWRRFDIVWEMLPPKDEARIEFFKKDFDILVKNETTKACIIDVTKGMSAAELTRVLNEARRRSILDITLKTMEAFLLAMLDHTRRGEYNGFPDKTEKSLVEVIKCLRKLFKKKYTFSKLEEVTGISHSTLHHKMKVGKNA